MTSQPNTIDDILEELVANQHKEIVIFGENHQVDKDLAEAKAALLEAIKTAKPEKKDYNGGEWHPKQWCPRNNAINEYEQNLINLFGGKQ